MRYTSGIITVLGSLELVPRVLHSHVHYTSFAGSEALIGHLHSCGIPLAVATGSATSTYQLKISKKGDIFSCFEHAVCSDDKELEHGKPAPDIYLIAAGRFGSPPKSTANVSYDPGRTWTYVALYLYTCRCE